MVPMWRTPEAIATVIPPLMVVAPRAFVVVVPPMAIGAAPSVMLLPATTITVALVGLARYL